MIQSIDRTLIWGDKLQGGWICVCEKCMYRIRNILLESDFSLFSELHENHHWGLGVQQATKPIQSIIHNTFHLILTITTTKNPSYPKATRGTWGKKDRPFSILKLIGKRNKIFQSSVVIHISWYKKTINLILLNKDRTAVNIFNKASN